MLHVRLRHHALQVKFPRRIFLIRGALYNASQYAGMVRMWIVGNHEDRDINSRDGFLFECIERLGDHANRCFDAINRVFSWLPVAATIEDAIFCVHGGEARAR